MKSWCFGLAVALLCVDTVWAEASSILPGKKEWTVPASIPWQDLSERSRALVRSVLERSVLNATGPTEAFTCNPEHYEWFLDHPDRTVKAWRRLGAHCTSITPRPQGQFAWTDDHGSEVIWETIHRNGGVRIWYAEGKVRPTPVSPLVPIKAVVVLTHQEKTASDGASAVQHHAELYVQTDSKTMGTLTKLMGTTGQKAAEQGLGQLQLFFSGISWYLTRHPEHVGALITEDDSNAATLLVPRRNP